MQFHLLSFGGANASSRVFGLAQGLVEAGQETHLWIAAAPEPPRYELLYEHRNLHLHRLRQPQGIAAVLPPYLVARYLQPRLTRGQRTAVLAEEQATANAILQLDWLLGRASLRQRVPIFWSTSNPLACFQRSAAPLARAARITTPSGSMRRRLQRFGVDSIVMPNGLDAAAYAPVPARHLYELADRVAGRVLLVKLSRWDPHERWLQALASVAEMRRQGLWPLLIAQGVDEVGRREVLEHARALGLRIGERATVKSGPAGVLALVAGASHLDVLVVGSALDPASRRLLFRGASAVLTDGAHDPWTLEAMAAGALVCTADTGEDYIVAGRNALVLRSEDPAELVELLALVGEDRATNADIRRFAQRTSRGYAWPEIVARRLLPLTLPSSVADPVSPDGASARASYVASSGELSSRIQNVER